MTRKTRIIDIAYNAYNNELGRTKTIVTNTIAVIDATPFSQCYEAHYALGHKKGTKQTEAEDAVINKRSRKTRKSKVSRSNFYSWSGNQTHYYLRILYFIRTSRPSRTSSGLAACSLPSPPGRTSADAPTATWRTRSPNST